MSAWVQPPSAWGRTAPAVAIAAAGEITLATLALLRPVRLGPGLLIGVTALAIATIVLLARVRMPVWAKAGLIAAGLGMVLALFALQDPAGLREVRGQAGTAMTAAAPAGPPSPPRARVDGDAALSAAVEAPLAQAGVRVSGRVESQGGARRLNWTITRGDERLWCGFETADVADASRAFADRIAAAAAASRDAPLDCGA